MKYRMLENENNRTAVRVKSPADDAMINAAIAYADDCGTPIAETEATEAEITSSTVISADRVHAFFGLDRD